MAKKAEVIDKWTEIENGMLTNIPRGGKRPPRNEPWRYTLFAWDVEVRMLKGGAKEITRRTMIEVEGETEDEASQRLERLVDGGVRVIVDGSRDRFGARCPTYALADLETERR